MCILSPEGSDVLKIGAQELRAKLEEGQPLVLVDIREADEFEGWHIHGSRNFPVYDALKEDREEPLIRSSGDLPRDRLIVTVCRGGIVSVRAAEVLQGLGYEALSLEGGMRGWGGVWSTAPVSEKPWVLQIRRNGKGCLSYLLGADGEAAAIDPSVDAAAYLEGASARGMRITHVFETHVHADHISQARTLCRLAGAELVLPPNKRVDFAYRSIADGEKVRVGGLDVEAISTPGHTSESSCYLFDGKILFTGDTLFVNAVGRPDLEKGDAGAEAGARQLYRSLRERLLRRFDDVRFYPCHHSKPIGYDGEPIGASLAEVRSSSELLQAGEETFVAAILNSLSCKPGNHESIVALNEGKSDLGDLDPLELEAGPNSCAAG